MSGFLKHYAYPVATLSGSIIGVGFLSLPYIAVKVGIWPMLFYFAVLSLIMVCLHAIFGRISLKTPDFKRWPGFVGFYFGDKAKKVVSVLQIFGTFGVLLAYLIVGSQFLKEIFSPAIGGSLFAYVFCYFAVLSAVSYFGVKVTSRIVFWALLLLVFSIILVFYQGFEAMHWSNIFASSFNLDFSNALLPYGAIIFSLWGTGLIPEVEEMVRGHKQSLKKIIVISTLIPAVFYLAFMFLVLSISGASTTESALSGLGNFLGRGAVLAALFMGVITTFNGFLAQSTLLKKIFIYDLNVKKFPAWAMVCLTPFVLFLLGINSFIWVISFIGGIFLSIDGIIILLMYKKIGGKNIIIYPLALIFILGIIYEIVYFTR